MSESLTSKYKGFADAMDRIVERHTEKIYEDLHGEMLKHEGTGPTPSQIKDMLWLQHDSDLSEGWEIWFTCDGEEMEEWH